jgi:hypothetical protein
MSTAVPPLAAVQAMRKRGRARLGGSTFLGSLRDDGGSRSFAVFVGTRGTEDVSCRSRFTPQRYGSLVAVPEGFSRQWRAQRRNHPRRGLQALPAFGRGVSGLARRNRDVRGRCVARDQVSMLPRCSTTPIMHQQHLLSAAASSRARQGHCWPIGATPLI